MILSWSYYFKFIVFILFSYILPRVINKINFEEQHVYLNMLIWICMFIVQSNLCDKLIRNLCGSFVLLFSVLWILFPYFYFDSNCSISSFIIISAKDSLFFMINSISSFKFLSTSFGKSKLKQNVLWALITIIFSSIIRLTSLNCCKNF